MHTLMLYLQVIRLTDTLENLSSGQESLRRSYTKFVGARLNGSGTSGLESGSQEVDVRLFVISDLGEALSYPSRTADIKMIISLQSLARASQARPTT